MNKREEILHVLNNYMIFVQIKTLETIVKNLYLHQKSGINPEWVLLLLFFKGILEKNDV